jgi:F-type H+-transporting ATPase subunit delta
LKSASLQYANALADIALEQGAAEPAVKQLADFGAAYAESAELRNFLSSPAVSREAKHAVIEKIVARTGGSEIIRNFLFVIVDHRRTAIVPEMVAQFQDVVRKRQGIAEAEVRSAVEMSAAQKAEMAQSLARMTGKKVETKYSWTSTLPRAVVRIGTRFTTGRCGIGSMRCGRGWRNSGRRSDKKSADSPRADSAGMTVHWLELNPWRNSES